MQRRMQRGFDLIRVTVVRHVHDLHSRRAGCPSCSSGAIFSVTSCVRTGGSCRLVSRHCRLSRWRSGWLNGRALEKPRAGDPAHPRIVPRWFQIWYIRRIPRSVAAAVRAEPGAPGRQRLYQIWNERPQRPLTQRRLTPAAAFRSHSHRRAPAPSRSRKSDISRAVTRTRCVAP